MIYTGFFWKEYQEFLWHCFAWACLLLCIQCHQLRHYVIMCCITEKPLICRPCVISERVPAFYAWGPRSSTEHFGIVDITKDTTSEPPRFPSSLFFFLSPLVTNAINTLIQHRFSMQPKSTHRLSRLLCSKTAVLKSPMHFLLVLDPWSHTSHLWADINGLSRVGSCEKYFYTFFSLALCTTF